MKTQIEAFVLAFCLACTSLHAQNLKWVYSLTAPTPGWTPGGIAEGAFSGGIGTGSSDQYASDGIGGGVFLIPESYTSGNNEHTSLRVIWLNSTGKLVMDSDASASTTFSGAPSSSAPNSSISASIMRFTPAQLILFVTIYEDGFAPTQFVAHFVLSRSGVKRTNVPASSTATVAFERITNDPFGFFSLEQSQSSGPLTSITRYGFLIPP